ncbi:hypothetical protein L1987_76807 [Smallanthus sonchifolius]|uniref:Uncharacterized protein n=1 Tax=Smallanthus sonchifolius TaxID=185202 RepID=A0ACB8Z8G3_9ASTR|nr:hypothetical protein L1987_76807 [Smallanthus sonchifolius]
MESVKVNYPALYRLKKIFQSDRSRWPIEIKDKKRKNFKTHTRRMLAPIPFLPFRPFGFVNTLATNS